MDSSHLAQHAGTAGALFASIFLVATSTMKTMIPLRLFSILTNLVLIATAIPTHNFLVIPVQAVMLVLNSYRLHQMLQLVKDVKRSVSGDLSMDWLKPFMTERKCKAGEMLFYKDEKADEMLYIVSGRFRWSSRASSCRWAPSSASSACCRPRTCARSRWNASKRG